MVPPGFVQLIRSDCRSDREAPNRAERYITNMNGKLKNANSSPRRKTLSKAADSEVRMQHQSDSQGDQDRAEKKRESYAEQKADGSMPLVGGFFGRENSHGRFLLAQQRAENHQVSREPELNFVTRLPQQIEARAYNQNTDDPQKLGHD
jgi:hypothetical protein